MPVIGLPKAEDLVTEHFNKHMNYALPMAMNPIGAVAGGISALGKAGLKKILGVLLPVGALSYAGYKLLQPAPPPITQEQIMAEATKQFGGIPQSEIIQAQSMVHPLIPVILNSFNEGIKQFGSKLKPTEVSALLDHVKDIISMIVASKAINPLDIESKRQSLINKMLDEQAKRLKLNTQTSLMDNKTSSQMLFGGQ